MYKDLFYGLNKPVTASLLVIRLSLQVVLLSVSAGDPQGWPDPQALEAVAGYTLLRTDRNGWIHLSTDGEPMWVRVERPWRL